MAEKLAKAGHTWRFVVASPPREVFAVTEQMVGTPPYRYEVAGPHAARVVEVERNSLVGHWRRLSKTDADGVQGRDAEGRPVWRTRVRWITVEAVEGDAGTEVVVTASRGVPGPLGRLPGAGAPDRRALQIVQLLTRGVTDRRTVYRDRRLPSGPISLVASWAGMLYPLYLEPSYQAARGEAVHTASQIEAIGQRGGWVQVRTAAGSEGWMERDQIVPAPVEATRTAQARTAAHG